jgi:hypothetical protein
MEGSMYDNESEVRMDSTRDIKGTAGLILNLLLPLYLSFIPIPITK